MPDYQQIRTLFDPSRDIYRTIEKVITYNASQESRLKAEISEYIATDSINTELHDLLSKMQLAMEQGGEHEIGVWVSGFYGSGKSSFTKYLGLDFRRQGRNRRDSFCEVPAGSTDECAGPRHC